MGLFDGGGLGSVLPGAVIGGALGGVPGTILGAVGQDVTKLGGNLLNNIGDPFNAQMPGANLLQPATVTQANQLYDQSQQGLAQQQAFLQAMQSAYGGVPGEQAAFARQLAAQVNGGGPNPAQDMLNQATQQNVAQQAALMASARGTSSNPALIARQAAQQGAQAQQQAAGQAATMRSNQQLQAQQQLAQMQQSMLGNQQQAQNAYNQGLQSQQQNTLGAIGSQNNAQAGLTSTSAQIESGNAQRRAGLIGGIAGGIGSAMGLAHGGMVPGTAEGGPSSYLGRAMASSGAQQSSGLMRAAHGAIVPGQAQKAGDSSQNDTVPAMLSPGEIVIPRSIAMHPDAPAKAAAFVQAVLSRKS